DITYKGVGAAGIRNSGNVQDIDLGAAGLNLEYTDNTETYHDVRAAIVADLISLCDAEGHVTVYDSAQPWAKLQDTELPRCNLQTFGQVLELIPCVHNI